MSKVIQLIQLRLFQSVAMCGGFFLLLCEIRFEHRVVVIDDWRPWMPIIFSGLMLIVIPVATLLWDRGGRRALIVCYLLAACLGLLGVLFHSEGQLIPRLIEVFSVWWSPLHTGASIKALHPPLLAPAAFMGLASIGLLFCISEKGDIGEKSKVAKCKVKPEGTVDGLQ
jgi:hypothetical protein